MSSHGAPLSGVRVLDLSRLLPGPYATQLLVELGAQVDKLEAPGAGDYLRGMPPMASDTLGAAFVALNAGKRSLGLNLKHPDGVALFHALVAHYDVVVDSFRPGVLDKLGIGPAALRAKFPQLIVVSIVGYPEQSQQNARAGHDLNFVAKSGLLTDASGLHLPTAQVADVGAALYAVGAINAALYARAMRGEGARVEVAMSEAARGFGLFGNAGHWFGKDLPFPADGVRVEPGPLEGAIAAYSIYPTSDDGRVALAALEPKFWARFANEVGLDPSPLATVPGEHQATLIATTKTAIAAQPVAFWRTFEERVDCCLSVVGESATRVAAVRVGDVGVAAFDPSLSRPAPEHGEHSESILRDALGEDFDQGQFVAWLKNGVVSTPT